jgi:hypothetical protein
MRQLWAGVEFGDESRQTAPSGALRASPPPRSGEEPKEYDYDNGSSPVTRGRGTMRSMVEGAARAPDRTFGRARALRRAMSMPEVVLRPALRKGRPAGLRFRRQYPIGPYVPDF